MNISIAELCKYLDDESKAIIEAGYLAAIAKDLDVNALEKFLESKPSDFRYEKECRAAIEFRKAIYG